MKEVTLDDILREMQFGQWELGKALDRLIPGDIRAAAQEAVEKQYYRGVKTLNFQYPRKVELVAVILALRRAYVELIPREGVPRRRLKMEQKNHEKSDT